MTQQQQLARLQELQQQYQQIQERKLNLDLTRGKPSSAQLSLSDPLDGILEGNYQCEDGTDARNYGGGLGIPEARRLAADYLQAKPEQVMVGGNSSLQLMYQIVSNAYFYGINSTPWQQEGPVRFLCPAPGYDRHFAICQTLNIEMIPVRMNSEGPDMDQVEALVKADPLIKGIWCVPKYSNPGGVVYSSSVVERMAKLGQIAGPGFLIMWDNAYAEHHLVDNPPALANILQLSEQHGTLDHVFVIGSTSKITFAGAGISFIATSVGNLARFTEQLGIATIGPDKVNQLRHVRFLKNMAGIRDLMQRHRAILQPKFDLVLRHLEEGLAGKTINGQPLGQWTRPEGGYFIQFDTQPGLADRVVKLTAGAGVKLTPAGATYPLGRDPENTNIRLAPSFPGLQEIDEAMKVFVLCVEIATLEKQLGKL